MPPSRAKSTLSPTSARSRFFGAMLAGLLVVVLPLTAHSHDADAPAVSADGAQSEHGSAAEVGAKLSDPTSNVWAMFKQFGITTSDGDFNTNDPEIGGNMIFQPIMPIPLFGECADQ